MANPEHLKILKQGVKAWNKWRKENPDIKPDLSGAYLNGVHLFRIDLSKTYLSRALLDDAELKGSNLSGADLFSANLRRADLFGANFTRSDVRSADLCKAHLSAACLRGANLSNAGLRGALLINADLFEANLSNADLRDAILTKADLVEAHFVEANLTGASLSCADLSGAKLRSANLCGADLDAVDLRMADLERADLKDADLIGSTLFKSNLTEAILTGAKLYGTARDDWIIKGVECEYVYWDIAGKHRSPKDRDLEPGEFERLYAALPTIEYIFESGMIPIDPLIMDRVVQAIRERRPEFDIKVDSINARGLAPSIKFTVLHEEHKEPALEEVQKGYEAKIAQLEAERDRYYRLVSRALDAPKEAKLTIVEAGGIAAIDGSTINIQHINYALELQSAIAAEPEGSESFDKVAKKTALDIIGGAIKDIAKGQVKEAAKQIIELGKDLGPIIAKMTAYSFFSNIGG